MIRKYFESNQGIIQFKEVASANPQTKGDNYYVRVNTKFNSILLSNDDGRDFLNQYSKYLNSKLSWDQRVEIMVYILIGGICLVMSDLITRYYLWP